MVPDWLRLAGGMWWHVMTTMRGWLGVAAVALLLVIAIGLPRVPPDLLVPGAHPWISFVAWALLAFLILFYAPGQALKEHKDALGQDFYRWDAEPNIDRAYRIFDRLYRAGIRWRAALTEQRQAWDQDVRKAILEHCNEQCRNIYLMNTGRIDSVFPLPDERYEHAMEHIKRMLDNELERDIKWPR